MTTTVIMESEVLEVPHEFDSTTVVYLIYAIIVPILACFGVLTNLMNAIIFMRPRMTPSAFTYLAAMSWMDCFSCFFMAFSGFSRSIFQTRIYWIRYDCQVQTPLTGITTGAANLILVSATLDRLIYLKKCLPRGVPRFCTRSVAKGFVAGLTIFSMLINIPYFFVFQEQEDGTVGETEFFHSSYYMVHNWITFILLAIFPAVFLLFANAIMISIIRKWTNCKKLGSGDSLARDQQRYNYQTKLTVTIVLVISLFLVGELPAHLTSKKNATNLLFGGDTTKFDLNTMELIRASFTVLNLIQLSLNIVIYAIINPAFMIEFFDCFRKISDWLHKITGLGLIGRFCRSRKRVLLSHFNKKMISQKQITHKSKCNCQSSCQIQDNTSGSLPERPSNSTDTDVKESAGSMHIPRANSLPACKTYKTPYAGNQHRWSVPLSETKPHGTTFSFVEIK